MRNRCCARSTIPTSSARQNAGRSHAISTPIPQPLPTYQFPAHPNCTPRRAAHYIAETVSLGLVGGWGFGGFLGIVVLMLLAVPVGISEPNGLLRLMLVSGPIGAALLGYVGWRALHNDRAERDDLIVATILFALAGGMIGAPVIVPYAIVAFVIGLAVGTIPGVILWLIYGLTLVLFTRRRYSPSMNVVAFRHDARRLAALTAWLATVSLGMTTYLLLGHPTSSGDVLIALALLTGLATLTAPFAWWHSKFLIDWWLADIKKSATA